MALCSAGSAPRECAGPRRAGVRSESESRLRHHQQVDAVVGHNRLRIGVRDLARAVALDLRVDGVETGLVRGVERAQRGPVARGHRRARGQLGGKRVERGAAVGDGSSAVCLDGSQRGGLTRLGRAGGGWGGGHREGGSRSQTRGQSGAEHQRSYRAVQGALHDVGSPSGVEVAAATSRLTVAAAELAVLAAVSRAALAFAWAATVFAWVDVAASLAVAVLVGTRVGAGDGTSGCAVLDAGAVGCALAPTSDRVQPVAVKARAAVPTIAATIRG